jgi:hypothetical protein
MPVMRPDPTPPKPTPTRPQLVIDIENSIKAQNSPAYEHWAILFNLKQMSQTLIYIQQNGYENIEALHTAHKNSNADRNNIQNQLNDTQTELKALREQKKQAEIWRNNREVYQQYYNLRQKPSAMNKFYEQNKTALEAYKKATKEIFEELKLEKVPSLKRLSAEIKALAETEKELKEALPVAQEKAKAINIATHNTNLLLGYRELELQDRHPSATLQDHKSVPIYKDNFPTAKEHGKMEQYFQNLHINKECSEAIKKALWDNIHITQDKLTHNQLAEIFIKKYGAERVQYLMGTTYMNVNHEDMSFPLHKLKQSVKLLADEAIYDRGDKHLLSHADIMAVAQKKADEYNQSRQVQAPQKPKSKGMTL